MTGNASEGERILATLHSEDGEGVGHMESRFATSIDGLGSALTEPDRLAALRPS